MPQISPYLFLIYKMPKFLLNRWLCYHYSLDGGKSQLASYGHKIGRKLLYRDCTGVLANFIILYSLVAIPDFGYTGMSLGIITLELIATGWNFKVLQLFQRAKSRIAIMLLVDILVFEAILIVGMLCSKTLSSLEW